MSTQENTSDRDNNAKTSQPAPQGIDKQNLNRTYGSQEERDMRNAYSGAGQGFSQDRDQKAEGLTDKEAEAIKNVNQNADNWRSSEEESEIKNASED